VEDPPLETLPFRFSKMNPGDYHEAGFVLALFHSTDKLQYLTVKVPCLILSIQI
jgi:hypothetical protein